ncbi:glutathione S-transferase [Maricurvus nonylphenolicus]|uniref:glutathione S-transferase family protein n=1 Tax=Maricurvus nonylphenolicus TaxID=1008307 RepID=UPI0036F1EEEF
MKIYDVEGFPNPLRVRVALAEKGALESVSFIAVDVLGGEHRSAAFLAKNPAGAVPVLELDDGTCIAECSAIIEYIDHQFDGPSLLGEEARQRAIIHMLQRRAEFMVLDAVGDYFHHATAGLGPALEVDQHKQWGEKQKHTALNGMSYFDRLLGQHEYVAGETFSCADITLYAGLAFAEYSDIEIPVKHRHLLSWRERIAKRPSLNLA